MLGYPDPRPHRTFANIRYALYEYWLNNYKPTSYILILDFRDTFFQANPFKGFGYPVEARKPKFELQVSAVLWMFLFLFLRYPCRPLLLLLLLLS